MSEPSGTTLTVEFTAEQIEAIDQWIDRSQEPKPSREEAVRQLVAGRLGAHGPNTMMPNFTTGRDIV
ncbi:hypothetical protein [Sphingomonas sp. MMS24-J13]|uniref:hypothetical protein n=1 Tax=Sphingomonas sp. MMS24-J13 TaxID=3238686 RepID=UPI003850688F